jgi:zinc protease
MLRFLPLLAVACFTAMAADPPAGVSSQTLANGMKVLIQEDHAIPEVSMYFFYKIGSRNEHPGTTGVSHFFEHMMFNGAKKYGPGQFDFHMEANGGNNNAYTSQDVTVYTDWFPPAALELMMDMEADRIRDLAFDPKIVESERGVVYSERRSSVDNSNFGLLYEQLNAAAYIAHPYHWPVVGWPSDIEGWSMADLQQHFRMGYSPNNCVMVVVGDVNTADTVALIRKYIEPIPSHDPPPPVRTKEPEQLGERRVVIQKAAQLPIQLVAYHVPETKHADMPALQVLDAILTSGQSSRLYRRMVDGDQIALSVGCNVTGGFDPGLMVFSMQPRSGIDPARTEKVLYEELDRIRGAEIPAAELRKAKNQMLAAHYRSFKTGAGRANMLGTYEVVYGSYTRLYTAADEIEAVTAADIRRVAEKYLTEKNRTVATLVPEVKR